MFILPFNKIIMFYIYEKNSQADTVLSQANNVKLYVPKSCRPSVENCIPVWSNPCWHKSQPRVGNYMKNQKYQVLTVQNLLI